MTTYLLLKLQGGIVEAASATCNPEHVHIAKADWNTTRYHDDEIHIFTFPEPITDPSKLYPVAHDARFGDHPDEDGRVFIMENDA